MKIRAERLLKEWCDAILSYRVQLNTPYTDGALLCPACHLIHGRIADLCFPLTVLWKKTGDETYLKQADKLIDWTEFNLKSEKGFWFNDIGSRWIGTSAFGALSIGEALYHYGDVLPVDVKEKWMNIFLRICDGFVSETGKLRPLINYYCAISALLAMAWRITGEEAYYEVSKKWLEIVLDRFDEEGLLYGEKYPITFEDSTHTIDMGYNLEESLPLLLRYSKLTGEYEGFFRNRLRDQLEFLLPDGGIDNSFGTRHNKWTYWGSRTCDGLIGGLALVLDDPMFTDACERVLSLYERCTHDGLLALPMAGEAGEPTCLHHTFTHAKALAALVCAEHVPEVKRTELPCEKKYGIKEFQKGKVLLVSHGPFRATFSSMKHLHEDLANGGGSMNLLYHDTYGVICAATSAKFFMQETYNQQHLRNADEMHCMTAQFIIDGKMACRDQNVDLTYSDTKISTKAEDWKAEYEFQEDSVEIALSCEKGIYHLPIVCKKDSEIKLSDDECIIIIDKKIIITSDTPMNVECTKREFHQVGGFLYLPISVEVQGKTKISLKIK